MWHFWDGPDRDFRCWYLNLQAPFRRTAIGYDTQDLELDIVVAPDGSFVLKDLEFMDQRVAEGRFTPELVAEVHRRRRPDHGRARRRPALVGSPVVDLGARPAWPTPTLPDGWADVPFDLA